MFSCRPNRVIETPRLTLTADGPDWAQALADYYRKQERHLAPWGPIDQRMFDADWQRGSLERKHKDFEDGKAFSWLVVLDKELIGAIAYTHVSRGRLQCATLGFGLAKEAEGKGFMFEAVTATQSEVFSDRVRLHRIEAQASPENGRSLALMRRLGFEEVGLGKEYLFVNGAWRDHVHMAVNNPDFDLAWM